MANTKPHDNALQHGLTSARVVIPQLGETVSDWEAFRQGWHDALQPANGPQREFADRIAGIAWRLRRAEAYQQKQAELQAELDRSVPDVLEALQLAPTKPEDLARQKALRAALALSDSERAEQARRYEVSLERSLERNLRLYEQLQALSK
jgi:hypothetical protein